jgi:hypothetical protein
VVCHSLITLVFTPHIQLLLRLNFNLFRLRDGEQPLRKKGRGRLIHVSDFINSEDGRLVQRGNDGNIIEDARRITYPGANGDPWWDNEQLLSQVKHAIQIFNTTHPDCQALLVFDQSSAHASLPPDALQAFDMNKSDGGKQRKQCDTVIPESNPVAALRGQPQTMVTNSGQPKGLKTVLEECGFTVSKLCAKCAPVCPFKSNNCCMARLLSQQDDFVNQLSMLEQLIGDAGHYCIFLPKFHCELNPIEMVRDSSPCTISFTLTCDLSTGGGANTGTVRTPNKTSRKQKELPSSSLMHAL